MPKKKNFDSERSGRFAYEGLDRLLHERARLGILTTLATRPEGVLFADLKELCSLTDGNLCRHLQVLHDHGVVELWKRHDSGRPQTLCRLSREGRKRFLAYLAVLEEVVRDAAASRRGAPGPEPEGARQEVLGPSKGWAPA
jgi:DNA-binding transcriptional ArsR family regulator